MTFLDGKRCGDTNQPSLILLYKLPLEMKQESSHVELSQSNYHLDSVNSESKRWLSIFIKPWIKFKWITLRFTWYSRGRQPCSWSAAGTAGLCSNYAPHLTNWANWSVQWLPKFNTPGLPGRVKPKTWSACGPPRPGLPDLVLHNYPSGSVLQRDKVERVTLWATIWNYSVVYNSLQK